MPGAYGTICGITTRIHEVSRLRSLCPPVKVLYGGKVRCTYSDRFGEFVFLGLNRRFWLFRTHPCMLPNAFGLRQAGLARLNHASCFHPDFSLTRLTADEAASKNVPPLELSTFRNPDTTGRGFSACHLFYCVAGLVTGDTALAPLLFRFLMADN